MVHDSKNPENIVTPSPQCISSSFSLSSTTDPCPAMMRVRSGYANPPTSFPASPTPSHRLPCVVFTRNPFFLYSLVLFALLLYWYGTVLFPPPPKNAPPSPFITTFFDLKSALALPPSSSSSPSLRFLGQLPSHLSPLSESDRLIACKGDDDDHCMDSFDPTASFPLSHLAFTYATPGMSGSQVPSLGTRPVCLPLAIVGDSVSGEGDAVVELGPFVGLSSRCLGIGLAKEPSLSPPLHVFDSFSGNRNENAIMKDSFVSRFAEENNIATRNSDGSFSFEWLWRLTASETYYNVHSHVGEISEKTVLGGEPWNNAHVAAVSIDSVKRFGHLSSQMSSLEPIFARGSLAALLDFSRCDLAFLVYGCLRRQMVPVYTSWCTGEHWIFSVVENVVLEDVKQCGRKYKGQPPTEEDGRRISKLLASDIEMLAGMGRDDFRGGLGHLDEEKECLRKHMNKKLLGEGLEEQEFKKSGGWRNIK